MQRIGSDFGIAVLVTSHLLGELEQVSDHVIVLDGGHLLRSSATGEFLAATGSLLVEVVGAEAERDRLGEALAAARAHLPSARGDGRHRPAAAELAEGVAVHDLIRDVAADLGLGLMRLQPDRRHLEDVFLDGGDPCLSSPRLQAVPASSTTSATATTTASVTAPRPSPAPSSSPACATPSASAGRASPR